MRSLVVAVAASLLLACGPDAVAALDDTGADDGLELSLAELNATTLLAFLNGPELSLSLLLNEARLEARAARGVVAFRSGGDQALGTADDRRFASVAEVDAVPYVGAVALTRLDAFAATRGGGSVSVEGVSFTAAEAALAVAVVNDGRIVNAGLSATAVSNLVAARPHATLEGVASVSYIGPTALTALRRHVRVLLAGSPAPTGCAAGTFDGVVFTLAEACHAVDYLNRARFSEMGALPDGARLLAYESGPVVGSAGPRGARWTTVAEFANRPGIGATAINGLKAGAAAWRYSGSSVDTVASTWAERTALVNKPIYLDRFYVTKLYPQEGEGGFLFECAEVRDAPGAANYLLACRPAVVCGGSCWDGGVDTWAIRDHGTWRRSALPGSGGYRLSLSN